MYVYPSLTLSEVDPLLMKAALSLYERSSDHLMSTICISSTSCKPIAQSIDVNVLVLVTLQSSAPTPPSHRPASPGLKWHTVVTACRVFSVREACAM